MTQMSFEAQTSKAPDEAWKVAGNFNIKGLFPGIDECDIDGKVRTLATMGNTVKEEELERDDTERMYSYSIIEGPFGDELKHKATVRVVPDGDGSRVIFEADVEPDAMAQIFQGIYSGAADAYKAAIEK